MAISIVTLLVPLVLLSRGHAQTCELSDDGSCVSLFQISSRKRVEPEATKAAEDEAPADQSYEEMGKSCDVPLEECDPTLLPNCEVEMGSLSCVPKGSVPRDRNDTKKCSTLTPPDCAKREGCEVAPNLMCIPKETALASLLEKRRAASRNWRMVILKNHKACTPLYPDLEVHAGNHGDLCRARGGKAWAHTCPDGCAAIPDPAPSPYCLTSGTREACRTEGACGPRSLHQTMVRGWNRDIGDHCTGAGNGISRVTWIAPVGCHALGGPPYSVAPGGYRPTPPGSIPCRVKDGTPNAPQATWQLIASGTNGVTTTMEVGVTSTSAQSVTRDTQNTFGASVTAGVSFDAGLPFVANGGVELETSASYEFSSGISKSIESVIEQDQVRTVEVECPDYTDTPSEVRNQNSSRTEYIWQFVVGDGNIMAKTGYFRCHQSEAGSEMPECPPELCGDPAKNPFCKLSLSPDCQKYLKVRSR